MLAPPHCACECPLGRRTRPGSRHGRPGGQHPHGARHRDAPHLTVASSTYLAGSVAGNGRRQSAARNRVRRLPEELPPLFLRLRIRLAKTAGMQAGSGCGANTMESKRGQRGSVTAAANKRAPRCGCPRRLLSALCFPWHQARVQPSAWAARFASLFRLWHTACSASGTHGLHVVFTRPR